MSEPVRMEFHVSRQARERYRFDEAMFSLTGSVILANLHAARVFAQRMNEQRDLVSYPERAVRAGQINAMGLIDEVLHLIVRSYREQVNPAVMQQALDHLDQEIGAQAVDACLLRFIDEFPPLTVYRRETSSGEYLRGETGGIPHRQLLLEEMLMLWLANANPAFAPFLELFDDATLARQTAYLHIISGLQSFFGAQPRFGPQSLGLLDMLRAPALAFPHSLSGQLEYMRERWGLLLGREFYRVLGSLDLIQEEEKPVFAGPGPARVYDFRGMEPELERFSPDLDWMPRVVLLAKNTYVWLDQLSQKYKRLIAHLDEVPDEELDTLARWGYSGLWLIGLWERSPASRKIKQLCGNPEAVASAYSLFDYQIAADLGGPAAFQSLKERAWKRGIRMASDMVPNHVGIYSRWMIEHPDWFISLDYSPFPSHRFSGPDLSEDERVGIFVEDHYYERSDAAVVFKRLDRWTGSEKYVYHGNDGTSMPWNDTAQLNYLNPEVREAVIQTILHVARQTPIIRFDAAMTLTKKHFQRLWFPEPGTGGAIPTRAEHGLTKAEFDVAMPEEFWREVVDRTAAEAPDTLLLAEAFWLLEGYFVRTLGMHRVYNSAFMHMLRDEDNAKYRLVIKNTLEFDPEILKRYVSFMNNPDEETAVAQFGKGDKYFGVCTLMATLPGLPMFGHGQVEGLAERYGMEYRRAYRDEQPDAFLVERHERQIFPLLHRRHLFAEAEHFLLYDFFLPDGTVNEDVFAYSNRRGGERALVVYHNRYATARGWIRRSAAYAARTGQGDVRSLVQRSLGEGLALRDEAGHFCIFRDSVSGLEYIRSSRELCENGLYVELDAYKCHVFLDWQEVQDDESRQLSHLNATLNGRGVPSIEEALRELFLQTIHRPFQEVASAEMFRRLEAAIVRLPGEAVDPALMDEVEQKTVGLFRAARSLAGGRGDEEAMARRVRHALEACLQLPILRSRFPALASSYPAAIRLLQGPMEGDPAAWGVLMGWLFTHGLGQESAGTEGRPDSRSLIDEWRLGKVLAAALQEWGLDEPQAREAVALVKILVGHQGWAMTAAPGSSAAHRVLSSWLHDAEVQRYVQENRYRDVLWFNKEAFERLLGWMLLVAAVETSARPDSAEAEVTQALEACCQVIEGLQQAEQQSGYQVVALMEAARSLSGGD
jgi:hypothetical protein